MFEISGSRRLKLGSVEHYDLVCVMDGKEMLVTSFDDLPDDSFLRFKHKELQVTEANKSSSNQNDENTDLLLTCLNEDIDIILTVSENDLKTLSDMKLGTQGKFNSEFLHRVSMLANQTLLMKQKQRAIVGIKSIGTKRENEFPVSAHLQFIGI